MDAVEFLKTSYRMCNTYEDCNACPVDTYACYIHGGNCRENPDGVVAVVEQWAKDHHAKTRKSELLKMFPNADVKIIFNFLSPCHLDKKENPQRCAKYGYLSSSCRCIRCRDDYWNEEVTDND